MLWPNDGHQSAFLKHRGETKGVHNFRRCVRSLSLCHVPILSLCHVPGLSLW